MKKGLIILLLIASVSVNNHAQELQHRITLKSPGNPAETHHLTIDLTTGIMHASQVLPVQIKQQVDEKGPVLQLRTVITAKVREWLKWGLLGAHC